MPKVSAKLPWLQKVRVLRDPPEKRYCCLRAHAQLVCKAHWRSRAVCLRSLIDALQRTGTRLCYLYVRTSSNFSALLFLGLRAEVCLSRRLQLRIASKRCVICLGHLALRATLPSSSKDFL